MNAIVETPIASTSRTGMAAVLREARAYVAHEMESIVEACCEIGPDGQYDMATMTERGRAEYNAAHDLLNRIDATLDGGLTAALRAGIITVDGRDYMRDQKGGFAPVKAQYALEDEAVRKAMYYAVDLSAQISRFMAHTIVDLTGLQALLDQEYGAEKGGKKGNVTYMSFDACQKIQIQIADKIEIGPSIQTAKTLIDKCLLKWGVDSRPELRALVNVVFSVEKEGQINRAALFQLQRFDIDDQDWRRAMDALRDSIRPVGTKRYVRFYSRPAPDAAWEPIPIDLARA